MSAQKIEECQKFIEMALECAVYLRPDDPGLSRDQMEAIAVAMGFGRGTLTDALDGLLRSEAKVTWTGTRLEPQVQGHSHWSTFIQTYEPDYRDFQALDAIVLRLRELAEEHTIAGATESREALIEAGTSQGISRHNMAVAFEILRFGEMLVQDKSNKELWRLSPRALARPLLPSQQVAQLRGSHGIQQRQEMPKIYKAVKDALGGTLVAVAVTKPLRAVSATAKQNPSPKVMPDKKKVFVIHGRNVQARIAVDHFLKSLDLTPVDFDEVSSEMGTEFVGNIVLEGMKRAHGIVSLFTPDEFSALAPKLRNPGDKEADIRRWQGRPNVIFEAGIAFGTARDRSVLVTMGPDVSLFSDIDGIHLLRLNNSVDSRKKFRQKLIGLQCDLNLHTSDWTDPAKSGDFEAPMTWLPEVSTRDPFHV